MIFTAEVQCICGYGHSSTTYGESDFPPARCPACGQTADIVDRLSPSIVADRLLQRSKAELGRGDYSLTIVIATMAVEAFLTAQFKKLKRLETYATTFNFPTSEQEAELEAKGLKDGGFPRSGGFLGPADFIAKAMTGASFDEFVAKSGVAAAILARLPGLADCSARDYFQKNLYRRRNRIAHWGFVNSDFEEAQFCHRLADAIIAIFREMDRAKFAGR